MLFKNLKGNLKKDFSAFRPVKVAVCGDSATQLLCQALRGCGYDSKLDLILHEADYDQMEREVLNPRSDLYAFGPEFLILFPSTPKLIKVFRKGDEETKRGFADAYLSRMDGLWKTASQVAGLKIIQFNFGEMEDAVYGHFSNKTDRSFLYQLRKINLGLMHAAQRRENLFINDVAALQSRMGSASAFSPQMYVNADMVFSLDFIPYVAKGAVDTVSASLGSVRKCLILDLDNTIWGGIIGDDGLENIQIGDLGIGKAFTELQWWAHQLKERGVILAVCSKNTESVAKEPFEKHPDMVLGLKDIAVFVANWDTKPENIRRIQSILNIGFDSMVFLDDNPFEREMVRKALPELTVPELPEDPAEYVPFLTALNLFEIASVSGEDAARTRMYQEEAGRKAQEAAFLSEDEFLASLGMKAAVSAFNAFNTPRVAQLSQRSNQFNLRTVRYSESEVGTLAASPVHITLAFNLEDKFGDYGLISAIVALKREDAFFIDTWIMSCRVLKRGMERFALNRLVEAALARGARKLIGEYIPTPKNGLVKDHYASLGFTLQGGEWSLALEGYGYSTTFIKQEPS